MDDDRAGPAVDEEAFGVENRVADGEEHGAIRVFPAQRGGEIGISADGILRRVLDDGEVAGDHVVQLPQILDRSTGRIGIAGEQGRARRRFGRRGRDRLGQRERRRQGFRTLFRIQRQEQPEKHRHDGDCAEPFMPFPRAHAEQHRRRWDVDQAMVGSHSLPKWDRVVWDYG